MKDMWQKKMDTYNYYNMKCINNGIEFRPCVTSGLGGFSEDTMKGIVQEVAERLRTVDQITLQEAKNRIVARIQAGLMSQIAKNGMRFCKRQGLELPKVKVWERQQQKGGK